jgi:UDP-2-acetamido-2-deoxy-ribo-hexuluronate aminotransferase
MEGARMRFMDLQTPYRRYKAAIDARMNAVFEHGGFILGPEVAELEAALGAYVGVTHVIGVASGTQSLELALRALGIGAGDEVVTVAFTFVGSVDPIALVGATPVFVDIDPESFTLDVTQLERAISPRTRAILPVSLFGRMPDYDAIGEIAARYGLPVIEDGAQSFGASLRGRKSCGVTRIGSTSFFPTKPLGAYGDGGALFTNDAELAFRVRALRRHGNVGENEHALLGTNSRLDTLQAAALLAKLPHLEDELAARSRIAARYSEELRHVVDVPAPPPLGEHVYALYTIRAKNRDELARRLAARGIPTAVYYPRCLHQQPVFASAAGGVSLPESERAAREVLSLPMHPFLTDAEQSSVIAAVLACHE